MYFTPFAFPPRGGKKEKQDKYIKDFFKKV